MNEIIESIKEKLGLIEDAKNSLTETQQKDLTVKLYHIDKDLRGVLLFYMAVGRK